jgi:hypothetical protein
MIPSRHRTLWLASPLALLLALQLVPYGRDRSMPADGGRPAWDSEATESLARRACFDCHSNETRWPWYASFAPMSWRISSHVHEGREALNFSAFDPSQEKIRDAAGEAGETVTRHKMPPADYLFAHPEARLSLAERDALARGLDATFAAFAEHAGREGREGREGRMARPGRPEEHAEEDDHREGGR